MSHLKQTLQDFLTQAQAKGSFDLNGLMGSMEPAFQKGGYRTAHAGSTEHILVLRLDEIGDNVLTSGFLRELRRSNPAAHITLVTSPAAYNIVELCPYVNDVLPFSVTGRPMLQQFHIAMDFCEANLWQRYFSRCYLPRWDFDRYFGYFLCYLSGARQRISYTTDVYAGKAQVNHSMNQLLTHIVPEQDGIIHEAARNFQVLRATGMQVADDRMELWLSEADHAKADELLKDFLPNGEILAVVAIGANERARLYPIPMLADALRPLAGDGLRFAIIGGPHDAASGDELARLVASKKKDGSAIIRNLCGKASLRESAAVMSHAALYVGNETGNTHIAAALRIPIVEMNREALSFPPNKLSYALRFAPWQVPYCLLRPKKALDDCGKHITAAGCNAPEAHCIKQVTPKEITSACREMLRVQWNK